MPKNYYLILGVPSQASQEQIQAAYRQQAKALHPDSSGQQSGAFLEVQEAYSVLRDPRRRRQYDQSRRRKHSRADAVETEPLVPRRTGEPFRPIARAAFGTFNPSFEALADRWFSNFAEGSRPKAERLESLNVEVLLSPEEALAGGELTIVIPAKIDCATCGGAGRLGPYLCWRCEGHGTLVEDRPISVRYPAGIASTTALQIPLQSFGIANFFLTLILRVTEGALV